LFIVMAFILSFYSVSDIKADDVKESVVKKVQSDSIIVNVLSEQISREEDRVIRNRALLAYLEGKLKKYVKDGIIEKEDCIRQNISALRTIDYAYTWALEQLKDADVKEVRMKLIETLDRAKYLNKMFADRTLKIEECNLKYAKNSLAPGNEMIKYVVSYRKEPIKNELIIPEEYQAARSPFR